MSISLSNPQALNLWLHATTAQVRSDAPDLTARQMALLLTVYLTPAPHTVRGLAEQLQVTKPVITRALDTLGQAGLLKRRRDDLDKRNVLVERTTRGTAFLTEMSNLIVDAGRAA
ncbi:MAG: MarR family transcriptional regulator [Alphaproteobacteria bacterium]